MTDSIDTSWDYVIAGAGSAGCVLAARLSEDPKVRVLLLEAGPEDRSIWLKMPAGMSRVVWGDRYSWAFTSAPEPHLENRRLGHPRGKVVGGSSSINGMVWLRGHARDFDGWAQLGARGWSYEDVLPYFCRSETAPADTDSLRGKGGPIRITRGDVEASPLAKAFVEAGVEAGYPRTRDFNGSQQEGFGAVERSTWRGRRWSAAHAYLNPVRNRPNLTVITGAHVLGIELEGQRATGLRYAQTGRGNLATRATGLRYAEVGREYLATSREVILCGGAIGSPHILQLSGIGPREHLEAAGIKVRHALSGVGENLNDHPDLVIQHLCKQPVSLYPVTRAPRSWLAGVEWILKGSGPAATNHFEAGGFITSRSEVDQPDIQFTFMPLAVVPGGTDVLAEHAFQVHIDLMRPRSRGHVRTMNSDPFQAPEILFNYLDDPQDLADLRAGVRRLREILSRPALAPFAGAELFPGPAVQTDDEIDRWIRQTLETCYHPVGTCRMGTADDPGAVVDPECRVRGLEGLRVVDASIMPAIVSANTNASTIMIAEKAADIIRGRTPLRAAEPTNQSPAQNLIRRIST